MHPVSFYEQYSEKQKGPGTDYQSQFGLKNIFRKIKHKTQNDFLFIPNITFANLYKLIHKVTFMPVSSDTLNLETRKGVKKYKKNEYFKGKKSFLHEIKTIFHNF